MNNLLLTLIASPAATPVGSAIAEGPSVTRLLLSLLVVLAVVFALALFWRRGTGLIGHHKQMKVLSAMSVGTRERVMLIQVGKQQLLIGVTPNQITHLQSFAEPVIDPNGEQQGQQDFSQVFKKMLKGEKP